MKVRRRRMPVALPLGHRCGEEGSATIWVVWAAVLLAAASVLAFVQLSVVSARHRAAAGADLAALSGVTAAAAGEAPCPAARSVAADQDVHVLSCIVGGDGVVTVVVKADIGAWLTRLLPAGGARQSVEAVARAGPGQFSHDGGR